MREEELIVPDPLFGPDYFVFCVFDSYILLGIIISGGITDAWDREQGNYQIMFGINSWIFFRAEDVEDGFLGHSDVTRILLKDDINRRVGRASTNKVMVCVVVGVGGGEGEFFTEESKEIVSFIRDSLDDGCIGIAT